VTTIDVRIAPPGSKSITNRALVIAALAAGRSTITGALAADDTRYMAAALRTLGIPIVATDDDTTLLVDGCAARVPTAPADLFVGNAGTAARFLPPLLGLGAGPYRLDGTPRMRERPIAPLARALRALGVGVDGDAVPLVITGVGTSIGSAVRVAGDLSSQYLSGLMLSAPAFANGLRIGIDGDLVSRPYVEMTAAMMRAFAAAVDLDGADVVIAPGGYRARSYAVEPDASAASYWFAAAAITGGRVVVPGLGAGSLQGDLGFVRILERMGCTVDVRPTETEVVGPPPGSLKGVDVDMRTVSDTAQTLAVVAPFASSPTRVTGIGFIRGKETDRIAAVVTELNRAGIAAREEADGFVVEPGLPGPARIETYDDHRMAMSFALLGLRVPGIEILDPGCVSKTYPGFFDDLAGIARR
jgi:3-phosphoshikimate 1-carboxyvinyltransferase